MGKGEPLVKHTGGIERMCYNLSMDNLYTYTAEVLRVVDGDTCELLIDCGFNLHYKTRVRLIGIDAPETTGATRQAGVLSAVSLGELVLHKEVTVKTFKADAFGRWLVEMWLGDLHVNEYLVSKGLASRL